MKVGSAQPRPKTRLRMISDPTAAIALHEHRNGISVHGRNERPEISQIPQANRKISAAATASRNGSSARSSQIHNSVWRTWASKNSASGRSTKATQNPTAAVQRTSASSQYRNAASLVIHVYRHVYCDLYFAQLDLWTASLTRRKQIRHGQHDHSAGRGPGNYIEQASVYVLAHQFFLVDQQQHENQHERQHYSVQNLRTDGYVKSSILRDQQHQRAARTDE